MPHLLKNVGLSLQLQGINVSLKMRKHFVLITMLSYLRNKVHIGISVNVQNREIVKSFIITLNYSFLIIRMNLYYLLRYEIMLMRINLY